jgi:hypothetical protein
MAISGLGTRQRGRTFGAIGRIVLSVTVLVPVTVLFAFGWQSDRQQASFATQERHGVEYLQKLAPLEIALTDAQYAAVARGAVPREPLIRAVDAMVKVDDRLGGDLRTHERWSELRVKIEALPTGNAPIAELSVAYGEAADLLLALDARVRDNSNLIRDSSSDTYYLEDAAAADLPPAVIAAGRYASLAVIATGRPASERVAVLADLTSARDALATIAKAVSNDIRLAVDSAGSHTVGNGLLSRLDRFSRGIDALIPIVPFQAAAQSGTLTVDPVQLNKVRGEAQLAATELTGALLGQVDSLLRSRSGDLNRRLVLTTGMLALAVLLVLALVATAVLSLRRRRPDIRRPEGRHVSEPPSGWPANTTASAWREPVLVDADNASWEQFGAAR